MMSLIAGARPFNGKTLAYQKSVGGKSDIYILRVGGKNPTILTAGLEGDQAEPAFSPDGPTEAANESSANVKTRTLLFLGGFRF
jgi:Tol biopolymer transport system component